MRISDPITFHGMTFTPSANRSWNYMTVRVSDDGDYVQACSQLMLLPSGVRPYVIRHDEDPDAQAWHHIGLEEQVDQHGRHRLLHEDSLRREATIASMEDASIRMLEDGSIYLAIWIDAVLASYARIMIHVPMSVKCIA